jgi:hypothetical protein
MFKGRFGVGGIQSLGSVTTVFVCLFVCLFVC